ncbi:MAG: transposase [Planctomycetota bacterium]|jgi:transposase
MKREHFMAFDVHCKTTEIATAGRSGPPTKVWRCPTTIPALTEAIESVPRPRHLVMEEGPLAEWLLRELGQLAEVLVICDPRRNRLIAKDSDKDDPIDAAKLVVLFRGGYTKPVHHPESFEQTAFKRHVHAYHDRVGHRVSEALKILWLLRHQGLMVSEAGFANLGRRGDLLKALPATGRVRSTVQLYWEGYDTAVGQVETLRKQLVRWARGIEPIRRFIHVPGIHWIRASTFYAYVDTPWRFRSKSALWRYMGIGLERRSSGNGPTYVGVCPFANRRLKGMILGAGVSAVASGRNPFADQHKEWTHAGISPRNARRNVARSLATTLWGMWKSGSVYEPEWVGVPASSVGRPLPRRPG